jgi:hypothetical protein
MVYKNLLTDILDIVPPQGGFSNFSGTGSLSEAGQSREYYSNGNS